jgi:hypothetical protein
MGLVQPAFHIRQADIRRGWNVQSLLYSLEESEDLLSFVEFGLLGCFEECVFAGNE